MSDMQPVNEAVAKDVPQITAPSNNRMIIAFPFSAVKIMHSDETISQLAGLLVELAEFVAKGAASPEGDLLAERARVVARQIVRNSER
jgi:hypothetical protein